VITVNLAGVQSAIVVGLRANRKIAPTVEIR